MLYQHYTLYKSLQLSTQKNALENPGHSFIKFISKLLVTPKILFVIENLFFDILSFI